jgi:hypothetical protein
MGGGLSQRPWRFESFPLRWYIPAKGRQVFPLVPWAVQLMRLFLAALLVMITLVGLMLWLFFLRGR